VQEGAPSTRQHSLLISRVRIVQPLTCRLALHSVHFRLCLRCLRLCHKLVCHFSLGRESEALLLY
jgi:hypothetical protein